MFYDRQKYTLTHESFTIEAEEPTNWNDDEKSIERNLQYHGITVSLSDSLSFVGEGRMFLEGILNDYGVNADVKCTKYVRNPHTDLWEVDYIGYVDFLTAIITNTTFSVKFNADPHIAKFRSKLSTVVELERTTSLTGKDIGALPIQSLYIEGREILQTSSLKSNEVDFAGIFVPLNDIYITPLPIFEQGDNNQGTVDVASQTIFRARKWNSIGTVSEAFIGVNETTYDYTFRVIVAHKQSFYVENSKGNINAKLRIARFNNAFNQNYVDEIVLWEYNGHVDDFPISMDIKTDEIELQIPIGYSASLQWINDSSNQAFIWPSDFKSCDENEKNCKYYDKQGNALTAFYSTSVTVYEDSVRRPSNSPAVKIYDFAKRLNDIIIETKFKSDLLQTADVSDLMLLHGMWLRGMTSSDAKYKPISTSLQVFLDSLDSIYPIGVDILDGVMSIEKRDYFYTRRVTIKIGEVSDLEISVDTPQYVTLIKVGYEKAGGYAEDQGLDEYNRSTDYDTVLNKAIDTLELISKYRADSYGLETARRENPNVGDNVSPDKDGKFDDNIWFVDCNKTTGTAYEISSWTKRFAQAPGGVYSPETAFNLWLSPINILLRHGRWIKSALLKYLDSWIAFNFSEGNSELRTKLIGGKEYTQNVGIPVADLDNSSNIAMIAEFKAPFIWNDIKGKTNGIPNIYGMVDFYYAGRKYKGHILSIKAAKGIGTFKVRIVSIYNTVV